MKSVALLVPRPGPIAQFYQPVVKLKIDNSKSKTIHPAPWEDVLSNYSYIVYQERGCTGLPKDSGLLSGEIVMLLVAVEEKRWGYENREKEKFIKGL